MNDIYDELRAALYSIWNRRWLALAITWAVCLLGWLTIALIPNSYESKTRIFVQLDDALAQQIGIAASSRKQGIERVRQTLVSAVNLEKVIRSTRLGAEIANPRQMEGAVAALAKQIEVKSEADNLFEITAKSGRGDLSDSENAQLARDIVQKMIDIFREENLGGSRAEMRESIAFLDQQLDERQKDLEAAEQRRLAFEAQHPELIGGAAALVQKLDSRRSEMRGIEADLAAAESALAAVEGQLAGTPRTLITPGSGGARSALAEAEMALSGLKARGLKDTHPDVIAQQRQVDALRKQAARQGDAGGTPNPAYSSLQSIRAEREASVLALHARKAALQSELSAIAASQSSEPGVAAEAQRISRDYEVLRTQYEKLLKDREELRLRGQVESERSSVEFEVIDPPIIPRVPAAPNRPLLLFGVLVIGLGAGAGSAFAVGQIRSTFTTAGALETAMGLPVLGTISFTLNEAGRALHARRIKQFTAASAGLGGLFVMLLAIEFIQRGSVA